MKIKKKWGGEGLVLGGGGGGGSGRMGDQGGCKRRIEVFVKIQKFKKKMGGGGVGGSGWGVRVDVNREVSFFVKIQKKMGGGQVGGGSSGVSGWM